MSGEFLGRSGEFLGNLWLGTSRGRSRKSRETREISGSLASAQRHTKVRLRFGAIFSV